MWVCLYLSWNLRKGIHAKLTWHTSYSLYSIIASRVLLNITATLQATDNLTTLHSQAGTELIDFASSHSLAN